jgi:mRNA-degrading endonuclease YafQ of YafQ-DinJ toxin-antitoxin module
MIEIIYAPSFLKQFNKLESRLQDELEEKILLFIESPKHTSLHVHKLHGELKGKLSFSINYKYRVIFSWASRTSAEFLAIGNHDVYK